MRPKGSQTGYMRKESRFSRIERIYSSKTSLRGSKSALSDRNSAKPSFPRPNLKTHLREIPLQLKTHNLKPKGSQGEIGVNFSKTKILISKM